MASYATDRAFTDYIHKNVALPKIYNTVNWQQHDIEEEHAKRLDMNHGIDYVVKDGNGALKTVQERFRESTYARYSDFTIRYRRDNNHAPSRIQSEYYKMKADFFLYGIVNGKKDNLGQCTDFIKYAIIDIQQIYKKIDNGMIQIQDNRQQKCSKKGNTLICPIKYNRDGSSSFITLEIPYLVDLWDNDDIIIAQKGFIS